MYVATNHRHRPTIEQRCSSALSHLVPGNGADVIFGTGNTIKKLLKQRHYKFDELFKLSSNVCRNKCWFAFCHTPYSHLSAMKTLKHYGRAQ